jgi:hypothetical protein
MRGNVSQPLSRRSAGRALTVISGSPTRAERQLCPASEGRGWEAGLSHARPGRWQDSGLGASMTLVVDLRYAHDWAVIVSSCAAGRRS